MARRSRKVKVNMKGVKTRARITEGMHAGKVAEVSIEKSDAGNQYLAWEFEISRGKHKGAPAYYNTSLQPQALWNLRGVLEALEMEVPDSTMELDLAELEDTDQQVCLVFERDDSYKVGQIKCTDVLHIDNFDSEDGGDGGEEEGGEDKPDAADVKKMDEDELEEVIDEHDLDVDLDEHKGVRKKRQAVIDALEESDDGGEEEKEEEGDDDKPSEAEVKKMDADELEEVIDDHDLDVDLDDIKGIRKQRQAVIDALEESDDGDGDNGDETYDEGEVKKMNSKALEALVEKHDLDVELEGSLRKKRNAVIEALKEEDLIEED